MTIGSLYDRVKSLDINKISVDSLTETSEDRINKNLDQLSKGINAKGDIVGVYASRQYAAYKQSLGSQAPFGIVDLKLTKSFYQGIKSGVSGLSIITDSTDRKSSDLQAKYGKDIFGLNRESKVEYIASSLRPVFNSKIEAVTGLKINK